MPGTEWTVYIYVAPGQGDIVDDRAYYLLDDDGSIGGSDWAFADHVEVIRTARQQAERTPPSMKVIRDAVSSAAIGIWSDDFDPYETEPDGENKILVRSKTGEGLAFQFTLTVSDVEEVDF